MPKDFIEALADKGWCEFVNEIKEKNKKSNTRLLRLLIKIKGNAFANDVALFSEYIGKDSQIRICREKKGVPMCLPACWLCLYL